MELCFCIAILCEASDFLYDGRVIEFIDVDSLGNTYARKPTEAQKTQREKTTSYQA